MPGSFRVFKKRFDVVQTEAGLQSHRGRPDFQGAYRFVLCLEQTATHQLIECVAKRGSPRLALLFHPFYDIVVQSYRSSDAHDASILASKASPAIQETMKALSSLVYT